MLFEGRKEGRVQCCLPLHIVYISTYHGTLTSSVLEDHSSTAKLLSCSTYSTFLWNLKVNHIHKSPPLYPILRYFSRPIWISFPVNRQDCQVVSLLDIQPAQFILLGCIIVRALMNSINYKIFHCVIFASPLLLLSCLVHIFTSALCPLSSPLNRMLHKPDLLQSSGEKVKYLLTDSLTKISSS